MKFRPFLPLLLLLLSSAGAYLSFQLTAYHYQNPKHIKNLLEQYPFLSRWIQIPGPVSDSGTPIFGDDGTSSAYSSLPVILGIPCNISAMFSCQKVDESPYAEILHIGVPVYGLIGYTWLLLLTLVLLIFRPFRLLGSMLNLLSSGIGLGFTVYLSYVEAFIIRAFCPLCLVSAGIITAHFAVSLSYFLLQRR
ncbi:MAG: vitamin K epoxide reductase family protein [bacterium]